VCGSRTFSDPHPISAVLSGLLDQSIVEFDTPLVIIDGGARGADEWARRWFGGEVDGHTYLVHDKVEHATFPADWERHGKSAGPIRNQQMLDEGKPEIVWAFVDKPLSESRGTANMVLRSRVAGLPVYVVEKIA
jgi:hypothetical protein